MKISIITAITLFFGLLAFQVESRTNLRRRLDSNAEIPPPTPEQPSAAPTVGPTILDENDRPSVSLSPSAPPSFEPNTFTQSFGFAGNGGGPFSDLPVLETLSLSNGATALSRIEISANSVAVNFLRLSFSDGTTLMHGRQPANRFIQTLDLVEGEYWESMRLWAADMQGRFRAVVQLQITLNTQRSIQVGSTRVGFSRSNVNDVTVQVDPSTQVGIVGFHGRRGDILDQLGVIFLEK